MPGDELKLVCAGRERIDDLEPLWAALQRHHAALAKNLPPVTARSVEESWTLRRASYEAWLSEPDAFVLIADLAGETVGYALVRVVDGFHSFGPAERIGSLETLSVLPHAKGRGAGTMLLDAVERELAKLGIARLKLAVVDGNEGALAFYERRGLSAVSHVLIGAVRPAVG